MVEKDSIMEGCLIVSLTSYPLRIPTLHYTLYSLFTQTLKPHKIILWLSRDEFLYKEKDLPQSVLRFTNYGLQIRWCEGNIKSYKKLIPTLREYADCIIVTADDDVCYPHDWLLRLYSAYKTAPQYIHCHRAHRIIFDENGEILPYMKWQLRISTGALWLQNAKSANDEVLSLLLAHYPQLRERIKA